MRIVSLLPSATEIVCALGLEDDLVGVTFECDHPPVARTKRVVSDTTLPRALAPGEIDRVVSTQADAHRSLYTLAEDALRELDPELVITQDLCAVCAVDVADVSDALAHLGCTSRVVTLDPKRLDDVIASVVTVGTAAGTRYAARDVVARLRARLARVAAAVSSARRRRVFVLEWTEPPYNAGHWIPDMVTAAGGEAVRARPGEYSVPTAWHDIRDARAEVVVVAPCGYDLPGATALVTSDAGLRARLADVCGPDGEVWAVDASAYFVRPGPRVVDGVEILAGMLHPARVAPPSPAVAQQVAVGREASAR